MLTRVGLALAVGMAILCAPAAHAANLALATDGATVVSTSSAIGVGDAAVMTSDLLTATKTPWYFDGDTRYIFGANDPQGTIEIDLGQLRDISDIGAIVDLPSDGDRPVIGPVSIEVSTDGSVWTDWESPVSVSGSSTNPISIAQSPEFVQYIRYQFGPTGDYYGDFGGAAVNAIFADGVPEPASWAMLILGMAGLGMVLRAHARSDRALMALRA
jgi:hypothetical protein